MLILSFKEGDGYFSQFTPAYTQTTVPVLKAVKNIEVYAKLRNKLNGCIIFLSLVKRLTFFPIEKHVCWTPDFKRSQIKYNKGYLYNGWH